MGFAHALHVWALRALLNALSRGQSNGVLILWEGMSFCFAENMGRTGFEPVKA